MAAGARPSRSVARAASSAVNEDGKRWAVSISLLDHGYLELATGVQVEASPAVIVVKGVST
jgi:hypothetical protein